MQLDDSALAEGLRDEDDDEAREEDHEGAGLLGGLVEVLHNETPKVGLRVCSAP